MVFTSISYSHRVNQTKIAHFFFGWCLVFEIDIWDPRRTIEDDQDFVNAMQTSYEMVEFGFWL